MSVAQIVYSLANSMQWLTGGAMGVKDISEPNIFGIEFKTQAQLYYFILVIAILLIIFSVRLAKSKYGRALKAVRDNPEAVESVGLSVTKLKLMAFLIATILGCLARCVLHLGHAVRCSDDFHHRQRHEVRCYADAGRHRLDLRA